MNIRNERARERRARILAVDCPSCNAAALTPCRALSGVPRPVPSFHIWRVIDAGALERLPGRVSPLWASAQ